LKNNDFVLAPPGGIGFVISTCPNADPKPHADYKEDRIVKRCTTLSVLVILLIASAVSSDTTWRVVKTRGRYAIMNKGENQGVQANQMLTAKRIVEGQLIEVGRVKVIRATPNRAAIEAVNRDKSLEMGDFLFAAGEGIENSSSSEIAVERKMSPIVEPASKPVIEHGKTVSAPPIATGGRKPWINLNSGFIVPSGDLGVNHTPSIKLGAGWMVPTVADFNLGVEVSKTFMNRSSSVPTADGLVPSSSNILEALVVFRKYFGDHFYLESGGGIYRPQITTYTADGARQSFSATNFGFFGGGGFFVPTSPFAGFLMRARVHNYYDQATMRYVDFSGGFRFQLK
jgi:hypothetical protein